MATLYCPECGYKNQYSIHPPNFCGGCGERISAGNNPVSSKTPKRKIKKESASAISEDETDSEYVPDMNGLQVDVSYEMEGRRSIKGEELGIRVESPENDLE